MGAIAGSGSARAGDDHAGRHRTRVRAEGLPCRILALVDNGSADQRIFDVLLRVLMERRLVNENLASGKRVLRDGGARFGRLGSMNCCSWPISSATPTSRLSRQTREAEPFDSWHAANAMARSTSGKSKFGSLGKERASVGSFYADSDRRWRRTTGGAGLWLPSFRRAGLLVDS